MGDVVVPEPERKTIARTLNECEWRGQPGSARCRSGAVVESRMARLIYWRTLYPAARWTTGWAPAARCHNKRALIIALRLASRAAAAPTKIHELWQRGEGRAAWQGAGGSGQ